MTVYDFDNTIYDGESGFDIFAFYLRKDPKGIIRFIPQFGRAFIRYKRGVISSDSVVKKYGYILREYCAKIPDFDRDVQEFWDKHEKKIKPLYFKLRTDDDVIVSACPEVILGEICRRIGVKRYIGSLVDPKTGEVGRVCYKEKKLLAFYDTYGRVRINDFYSDSMSDMPLMEISDNVYLVRGEKLTKIRAGGKWLIRLKSRFAANE